MSLLKSRTFILHRAPSGAYVKGRWVSGAALADVIFEGTGQPAGEDMKPLLEGQAYTESMVVYCSIGVKVVDTTAGTPADKVEDAANGKVYNVIRVWPWDNGLIPHTKILMIIPGATKGAAV